MSNIIFYIHLIFNVLTKIIFLVTLYYYNFSSCNVTEKISDNLQFNLYFGFTFLVLILFYNEFEWL